MTDKQKIKEGDLVVFRSRIDCQKATSAEYDSDGHIKSLYVADDGRSTLLKWEERAADPVIELHISFEDVLKETMEWHKALQEKYEHRYIDFGVEQVPNPFGKLVWKGKLYVEEHERHLPERVGYILDWEMSEDEVKALVEELFDDVVNNFILV